MFKKNHMNRMNCFICLVSIISVKYGQRYQKVKVDNRLYWSIESAVEDNTKYQSNVDDGVNVDNKINVHYDSTAETTQEVLYLVIEN